MKWEKNVEVYENNKHQFTYKGIITTQESQVRGTTYQIEMLRVHDDGSKDTVENLWHDTLAGAKKLFDKDFSAMGEPARWIKLETK